MNVLAIHKKKFIYLKFAQKKVIFGIDLSLKLKTKIRIILRF